MVSFKRVSRYETCWRRTPSAMRRPNSASTTPMTTPLTIPPRMPPTKTMRSGDMGDPSAFGSEGVAEIGPGALEARLDRIPAFFAGALEQLEAVERLVVPGLRRGDDPRAFLLGRGHRFLGALRQRRKL